MTRIEWTAGPDRVSHAAQGRDYRTLCHIPRVGLRYAWPPLSRCQVCLAKAEDRLRSARAAAH
jgi:hypothetical protein